MQPEQLQDLLIEQLRDIYDAEKQLVKALPKLVKAAGSQDLSDAIQGHLQETQGHVTRLESAFDLLGVPAKSKPCKGMRGLIEEGGEAAKEENEGPLRDLAIIAAAQRVEHYEISAYGTARTLADRVGNERVVALLEETEQEEKAADEKLTGIADSLYDSEESQDEEAVGATTGSSRRTQRPVRGK
jgi:ferritin-like metal-binding protein YciE